MVTVVPTEHLSFRLLEPNATDAVLLWELDQDPEVMRFINGGKPTSKTEIDQVFLPRLISYTNPESGWGMWGVFDQQQFVGWILVRPMNFFSERPKLANLELGWRFKRSTWGKGIATEAAQQVMRSIREQTGVTLFSAIAVKENTASIRIIEKLGMQFKYSGIHHDPLGDMQVDTYTVKLD
ncbi:GNAT family N-acetyltransferase [Alteromonas sp. ASW11-36]|uniref:GNAT family N-acetyltransferase n=1 Tax=Alteromonas arenosi TaxID=3055817 RepID=A0ABT7SUR0_9ALTE|nr:GNAT family N-acetyltransferase [Alteromonas sp. ASW11-36]MDM7859905.1 GNAT family N-acetyltransferase [Alteromonas sp. ASW11-36]